MSLPPIKSAVGDYSSLVTVKRRDPQTTKSAIGMYNIKPKPKKLISKIDTMEINRKSSAGSSKTPVKKRIKNQSNSALSKYPSPKNRSSIKSGDDEMSPMGSTPRSKLHVHSMLSDYEIPSPRKSPLASRQNSTIAEQHKNTFIEK